MSLNLWIAPYHMVFIVNTAVFMTCPAAHPLIAGAAVTPGASAESIGSFAAHAAASWRMPLAGAAVCAKRMQQPLFSALSA